MAHRVGRRREERKYECVVICEIIYIIQYLTNFVKNLFEKMQRFYQRRSKEQGQVWTRGPVSEAERATTVRHVA